VRAHLETRFIDLPGSRVLMGDIWGYTQVAKSGGMRRDAYECVGSRVSTREVPICC
jgi:hypothetical protein